ncbi:DUF1801 domain-containing protein [Microbacterium ureisolvens]|uniref:DUF1801 domain-containing protein n=1 Tax=Microbacterium ureisolvens TaxID=2781186 RepID=A0ABS7HUY8_9MICO|nr:DUF1801 domain-containing protein [Microbacterium ureisolvens]MBW9109179.1 DUF1801 domain-containing protein [Microbacterium ureisolvens]
MAAGIVTTDSAPFRGILDGRPAVVSEIALAARRLIFDVLPQTVEVVWPAQRSSGYGTGPKKNSEQFAWILPHAAHVALAFPYGAELDDPAGLLGGTGAKVRNVRLASLADVARFELRTLLEQAMRHRMPPPPTAVTVGD